MENDLGKFDFFDLISERNMMLREKIETTWNDNSDLKISNSEWYILSKIYGKEPTISSVSKIVSISRQATHKNIKSLGAKGLVEVFNTENNRRDKCIRLTHLGQRCYEINEKLKAELERKITETIGESQLAQLKTFLKLDWGL